MSHDWISDGTLLWIASDGRPMTAQHLPAHVHADQVWILPPQLVTAQWCADTTERCGREHPEYHFVCALPAGHAAPTHWDPIAGHAWIKDGRSTAGNRSGSQHAESGGAR